MKYLKEYLGKMKAAGLVAAFCIDGQEEMEVQGLTFDSKAAVPGGIFVCKGKNFRVEYLKEEQTRNLLVSEHEELVKAIREGDVQKAQDISFHHLENQRMAIIRTIRAENAARESEKKE